MASDSRISIQSGEIINDGSDGNPVVIKESMDHFSDTAYKTFLMEKTLVFHFVGMLP